MHLADYYSRPVEIADGDGCYLFDKDGKKYVDFLAGWCVGNIGWKRPEVRVAIQKEAERGVYVPPVLRFKGWEEFANVILRQAQDVSPRLARAFRCTSGSEAVEFAIKCARAATGKRDIVSIDGVYHGHTYGAASVGDACSGGMTPCAPGFIKLPMPIGRGLARTGTRTNVENVIKEFQNIVKENKNIAAFLSEPVWTNAGSIVPPLDFYPAIQKICRQNKILFIMDEVATGFGRCGKLFASELWGLEPDIMCLGKGLTGGYATMGATLVTEEIYRRSEGIPYYSTFGWAPQDLAAARANVEVILNEKLWQNAAKIGEYLLKKMKKFEELPFVKEARGVGLVLGIEIDDYPLSQRIQDECARQGLIIETAGRTLFMTPPLILTKEIADEGLAILKRVLKTI